MMGRLMLPGAGVLLAMPAEALPVRSTSVGPVRITCRSAASCDPGIDAPAGLRYQINATNCRMPAGAV